MLLSSFLEQNTPSASASVSALHLVLPSGARKALHTSVKLSSENEIFHWLLNKATATITDIFNNMLLYVLSADGNF